MVVILTRHVQSVEVPFAVKGKVKEDVRLGFCPNDAMSWRASWEFAGPGLKGPEMDLSVD